jgi:hypothetical protein
MLHLRMGNIGMDQIELRYQSVQCHVRSARAANEDDAAWMRQLGIKLALMADVEGDRLNFYACRVLATTSIKA